jgi:DNA-binding GntR family transcriptional regulator
LGVSRFPVSEALARLAAEGLVDILPQRGSTVSLIKVADVLEWMLIRKALEAEAVRVVAAPYDGERIEALRANLAAQRAAADADSGQSFHELDVEFHELLLGDARLEKLSGIIDQARANLDRARRLILDPRRLELTLSEHLAIFEALEKVDGAAAAAAMRRHIDSVIAELIAFAHDHPALFADGEALLADPVYVAFRFG